MQIFLSKASGVNFLVPVFSRFFAEYLAKCMIYSSSFVFLVASSAVASESVRLGEKLALKEEGVSVCFSKMYCQLELQSCLAARAMKDLLDGHPVYFCRPLYDSKGWLED